MAVPYTFGSATTSIPLSQLDSNFATTITLGNTAVQLGNTITTLTGLTSVTTSGDSTISGLTVGKGGGAVANNTVVGNGALAATSGGQCTAIGNAALAVNTATNNTAVGTQALTANTSGANNDAFGYATLYTNTTGTYNTAIGGYNATSKSALFSNTSGSYNIAVGNGALQANTTASFLTALGYQAGYSATSGYSLYVGNQAGYNTTGAGNTFVGANSSSGFGAGYAVTTGGQNTILGGYSGNQGGLDIRTATNNIVLSDGAGNPRGYFGGAQVFTINANTGQPYVTLDFAIGASIKTEQYYEVSTSRFIIQNSSAGVYLASGGTSWTSNSDERKKDIIEPITDAVNKVSTLRTVIGKYKTDTEGTRRSFLIAQDVQAVFPEAVDAQNPDDLGVQYSDVIPLLVASIKELKTIVDAQATEITALKAKVGI